MGSPQPTPPGWSSVVALAEGQQGLVRREQLLALGHHPRVVRRLVHNERLKVVHPGVYALGHRAITRSARHLAAAWWIGEGSALSHESAAEHYGWRRQREGEPIHVSTLRDRKGDGTVAVHRMRQLDHHDVMTYGDLRVTDRVRTLIDLADHLSYDELRAVADELPSLPKAALIARAGGLPGRVGAGRVQRLIHSEDAHTRSEMERRSVAYFARHGVPEPDGRNVRVHGLLVDCWWPAALLVVELDSRAYHLRRKEWKRDRERDRRLGREDIWTIRLTWHDLDPADGLAAQDVKQRLGR